MSTQTPVIELMKLVSGFQVSQAISVAATLGIADIIKDASLPSDEIAAASRCHPRSLYRLMHMLASAGVVEELPGRCFKLTAVGTCLRSDSPHARVAWARYIGRPYVWQSWGDMLHSVRTGESSFGHLHQENLWAWRSKQPAETAIFDAAMSELSRTAGDAVALAYDFSKFATIADVGGGQGALLAAILAKHTGVKGILFDLPHVVVGAPRVLEAAGVADRCRVIGGDVFNEAPAGANAYLIKSVLMDEDDDQAVTILDKCRAAAGPAGKVIAIEHLLTQPNAPEVNYSDATMMIMTGGRERTREEFAQLFAAAGLGLEETCQTASPFTLMIGTPV
jgi:hypothetical protein